MRPILIAIILALMPPALAADASDLATEISQEIMSPFCPGVTLHDCASDAAVALRERIETWARAGWSKARIFTELEAEYGSDIHAVPEREGFGWFAWLLPAIALIAGVAGAATIARRWAHRLPETDTTELDPADKARIDSELESLRGGA